MTNRTNTIVIMGVSGSGKTSVGKALSDKLGWQFKDADDYHPMVNKEKMRQGFPLNDQDREPWLQILRDNILSWSQNKTPTILACSALKQSYRETLIEKSPATFVYLKTERDVLQKRLESRSHEYMNPALLDSQLNTMEEPDGALVIDGNLPIDEILVSIVHTLSLL